MVCYGCIFGIGFVAFVSYSDNEALRGDFVYDDLGTVEKNVLVNGVVKDWATEIWKRDFWGAPLEGAESHKSFRPITTLSYKLDWVLSEPASTSSQKNPLDALKKAQKQKKSTFRFHVVNVILHSIVSMFVTLLAGRIIQTGNDDRDRTGQVVAGLLFALHPVHTEAVSNVTGRSELLMSIFFLSGIAWYLRALDRLDLTPERRNTSMVWQCVSVTMVPMGFMILSVLSKEQGISTLLAASVCDICLHWALVNAWMSNLWNKARSLLGKEREAITEEREEVTRKQQRRRMAMLACRVGLLVQETAVVSLMRIRINGSTKPDFVYDQNPAAFAEDKFTRVFSMNYVYCLYIRDFLLPLWLCCDWSGDSIPLIQDIQDFRIAAVFALWMALAGVIYFSFLSRGEPNGEMTSSQKIVALSVFGMTLCPFLLSSNLFLVVGTMKADRLAYLPSFGLCLLAGWVFAMLFVSPSYTQSKQGSKSDSKMKITSFGQALIATVCALYLAKLSERNLAWSSNLRLWESAVQVNTRSRHAAYNYGYFAALEGQFDVAERTLRPLVESAPRDVSTTFVYSLVLQNLGRCEEALGLVESSLKIVESLKLEPPTVRTSKASVARHESNLLVAKGLCTQDIPLRGKILYKAIEVDPSNDYAVEQGVLLLNRVKSAAGAGQP